MTGDSTEHGDVQWNEPDDFATLNAGLVKGVDEEQGKVIYFAYGGTGIDLEVVDLKE